MNASRLIGCIAALALTFGCAAKMTAPAGKLAADIDRDRAECTALARAESRGDLDLWPLWAVGWWPVDAVLAGVGLIGGSVKYVVTHERSVGEITDTCRAMRGYTQPEKKP
jgi:hypothetical protein